MMKLNKVKPMFNRIITTMDSYEEDQMIGNMIDSKRTKGSLKEYQKVVAVGSSVKEIKEGDIVAINPTRYMVMKHEDKSLKNGVIDDNMSVGYRFNTIILNGIEHLMLYDQDIDFIIEDFEEDIPQSSIVINNAPKIIV